MKTNNMNESLLSVGSYLLYSYHGIKVRTADAVSNVNYTGG